ncbi:phosphotransferase [Robbsia sp. Bb-Pol-6]|uniref:Phosphotransferase n=1 Tax=Robbsia betulipollinis TaxID=2981849 RepID=A0ABT3ZT69_9BURK|nr:phosphotransferase [Robbsia betulipollinis]
MPAEAAAPAAPGEGAAPRQSSSVAAPGDGPTGQFGVHGEQVERDWPLMTVDEVARVLASYPIEGTVANLSWHSPRPFAAAVLATLSDGRMLFVKRHDARLRDATALAEEHRFIGHLGGRGIPVAEVLSDRRGRTALAIGAWVYEVHRSADGLDAYRCVMSWEPFKAMSHAYAAGRALARLHRASAGFPAPARPPRLLLSSFGVIGAPDLLDAAQAWIEAQPLLASALARRPWRHDLATVIGPYHARLAPLLPSLAPLWTHGDWHASNLLWSPEGEPAKVRSVLDFGLADRTCAVYDLALAIERNTIEWLVEPARRRVHAGQIDALLDGYASVAPLDAADYRALVALLPIVHTEFALSEVAYFDGILDLPAEAEAAYSSYLLGHAQWFGEPAGRALLTQLNRRGHALDAPGR